ncbi:MAG: NAD-dependent DNA ligase LigA [Catonella sp.]|jgi:DNA ligase (NAD+)|nr:NAD-dependent DNA ligase LigA [Catonella sp.]
MSTEAKRERIRELTEQLDKAARAYYVKASEVMTNAEYDRLYDELVELENETGIVMSNSVTHKVGYTVSTELPKERHPEPRLSLDKTKEVPVLQEFLGSHEGILMWKLDGLTVVLTYENGSLIKALTRGNGEIGEVVTENARVFKNVPLSIPNKGRFSVRGEAVIKYSDFNAINERSSDIDAKYKNPRNLVSGSVRQLNTKITAERNVYFIAYEVLECEGVDFFDKRTEQLSYAESIGFTVVDHPIVTRDSLPDEVARYSEKIKTYDIPSDGLVLQYNSISYGLSLGRTAKFPRHSLAFKWRDETAETTLRKIDWSASRTGLINPVAVFDPVELEGTTVTRASVHNVSVMRSLRLGVGDTIKVYKANMIIPQILENETMSATAEPPAACPVCGGETRVEDEDGVQTLYCMNPDCMAKKIKLLTHFVSRDAMNIVGLSEKTLEDFTDEGYIHELADVFKLSQYKQQIVNLPGFGVKSYDNLVKNIDAARKSNAVRLLYSMGIPEIGLAAAKLIAKHFKNDPVKIENANTLDLVKIDGIGEVMADTYVKFFENTKNRDTYEHVLSEVKLEQEEDTEAGDKLSGLTFVITGDVTHFKNRNELKAFIESNGGKATGSVTGKTSYLINNDVNSSSTKNKKAKELGVPIISEEDFLKIVEG